MKMSQGNSLYSYLKQTKMSIFLLQNCRTGVWNSPCLVGGGEVGTTGRGRRLGKGVEGEYGANTVYTCI
jgi:hypothetical protein